MPVCNTAEIVVIVALGFVETQRCSISQQTDDPGYGPNHPPDRTTQSESRQLAAEHQQELINEQAVATTHQ